MSEFTPQQVAPERKPTPGTVNLAAILQWAALVLGLVGVVLLLMYSKDSTDAVVAELKRQEASQKVIDQSSGGATNLIGVLFTVALGLAYAILGIFNRKGVRGARITTWILSAVLLLCNLIGLAFTTMFSNAGTVQGIDYDKVMQAASDATPAFYGVWTMISAILALVIYLAVIVLLALPASNEFFRKAPPQLILPGDPIA